MVIWFCRRRHCRCCHHRRRRHRRVLKVDVMLHELKLQICFSSAERSAKKFRQEKVPGIRKLLFLRTEFETSWELGN